MNGSLSPACLILSGVAFSASLSGCLLAKAVTTPVKIAAATVVAAGETATTVVKTTGKVARAAVSAGGSATSSGLDGAARLSQAGMVTFVDVATGTLVRVPWQQGLTLAQAKNFSNVQMVRRAVDLVRAGKVVYAATRYSGANVPLAAGDVVRLAQ